MNEYQVLIYRKVERKMKHITLNSELGTNWVAPGDGATPAELHSALANQVPGIILSALTIHLDHLPKEIKTRLCLTGRPLQDYDFDRILALGSER